MYREAGSVSVLSGVPSGPYTGAKRVIDASLLEEVARQKLERALNGTGEPSPIAYERGGLVGSAYASWGLILAIGLFVTLFAVGFSNIDSQWAMQPMWTALLYLACGALFAVCLVAVLRRRTRVGEGVLRGGRYLFPLDAIDVRGDLVTVWPLGSARDATIVKSMGRFPRLVIRFDGGESLEFPVIGDPSDEVTMRRLEHAQRLLEELTYKRELEHAFTSDLFFDLRVDKSWDAYAPGAALANVKKQAPFARLLGAYAPIFATALALVFGGGLFELRRWSGDVALYNQAVVGATPEALDRYLAVGQARRDDAIAHRQMIVALRQRQAEEAARPKRDDFGPQPDDPIEIARRDEACISGLRARSGGSTATEALIEMIHLATRASDRVLSINFGRDIELPKGAKVEDYTDIDPKLRDAQGRIVSVFGRVLAEVCGTSTLSVSEVPFQTNASAAVLVVDYRAAWASETWGVPGGRPHKLELKFVVRMVDIHKKPAKTFTLNMPAPATAPDGPRPQSLFEVTESDPENRVYSALTARAFDRLYDEIWSLFFTGDPRVPVVPPAVLQP